jgi:glycerophosphoryl diester phosphodiesterase
LPPLIIAHRGDSAHRPENTLCAFASALELGSDLVELDVQLTRDGAVVVIHDPAVDRTTNGSGDVRQMTLAELRALSAGYPDRFGSEFQGERVPTLAEALGLLRGRARVMIELKTESVTDAADSGLEAHTLAEVRKAGMERDVALISFDRRALLRCLEQAPDILRGHLFYRATPDEIVTGARAVRSELIMPHKDLLSDELCSAARGAALRVATWVVDEPEELRALARFELFGVGTNRPGVLLEALHEAD